MAKSDLLKEAIADAKAVKETALANAKIALEEAFAPRIQSMLSAKLAEEEMEAEEEMMAPEAPVEEHEVMYQDDETGAEMPSDDDLDMSGMGDDMDMDAGGMDAEAEIEVPSEAEPEMEPEMDPMALAAGEDDMYNEDLELEEIIRELEEDLNEEDEMDAEAEQDLTTEGEEDQDEINIDEIIESILSEDDDEKEMPTEGRGMVKDEDEDPSDEHSNPKEGRGSKEEEKLEEELTEAYDTIESLRDTINEVNLLNAKLLYTNKLFRSFELDENQKMKVIENFDRAGNTREVKLVFSTLAESFHVPVKKRKKIVREGIASKPAGTTAPSATTKKIINEGNELANRWKKLAGLLD
tara:strand:- start:30501 stop:31559 length:1059 start_codon:yes stop_codon:yes gene_type:complete